MLRELLTVLLTAASLAFADLTVVSPAGGATVPNTGVSVTLSGATGMTILVQVAVGGAKADGSDSSIIYSNTAAPYTGTAISVVVPASTGPLSSEPVYYLKVTGTPATGGASMAYSERFTISGMSGGWPNPAISSAALAAAALGATAVPANQAGAAGASAASGSNIAFSLQTGLTKYAPMQMKPGTAITAVNTAPLYPTSAWSMFTTIAPIPSQVSTQTPSATYSVSSRENTASPAALPSDDMAKYLARWKD